MDLQGKRVKIVTRYNFFYRGPVIEIDERFITHRDERDGKTRIFSKTEIAEITIEDGGEQGNETPGAGR